VKIPDNGAQGVIFALGGRPAGLALYVQDDHLVFENNSGRTREAMTSTIPLPHGAVVVAYEFVPEGTQRKASEWESRTGTGRLYINGQSVGEMKLKQAGFFDGSMGIGRAFGSPVSSAFDVPFPFTGTIDKVTVNLQ
jgi:arylsulfatase